MATLIRALAVFVGVGWLAACGGHDASHDERLVGIWQSNRGETLVFDRNGTVHTRQGENRQDGQWETPRLGHLMIHWNGLETPIRTAFEWTSHGDLVLTDAAPGLVYTKQR